MNVERDWKKRMVSGNYIDGEWVQPASGTTFERRSPADSDDVLGVFPLSGATDVDAAVAGVATGYRDWADLPPERRAHILESAAAQLEARQEELARELVREEGKTLGEATNELRRTPRNLRFYAGEALRLGGETFATGGTNLVYTSREPVGVVGAITPWNFPLNIPSRKLGPALAAGNGVVFKPSDVTPLMGQRLVEILIDSGVPGSALALVQGAGEAGQAIAADPRVAALSFTGSYAVGCSIHQAIGPERRSQLEMGGKNPVIVLDDADLDRAAQAITKGAFGLTAQACTGTSRVITVGAIHDDLVDRVSSLASELQVGNGLDPSTDMGPLATQSQLDKYLDYIRIAQDEGARPVTKGDRLTGDPYDQGFFVRPAVYDGVEADMRIARDEVFGPLLGFQHANSVEEAIQIANASDYGLSAAIMTRDLERALSFTRDIESGLVKINQPTTGMALNAPFGGLKSSSTQTFKEQAGETMMHFYTVDKTVYMSP